MTKAAEPQDTGQAQGNGQRSGKGSGTASVWRNPLVIAAVLGAVIAGLFGLIQAFIVNGEREPPGALQGTGEPIFTFSNGPLSARMIEISRALRKEPGAVPIPIRLQAITALRGVASESPPADFYPQAVEALLSYLRHAVDERRSVQDDYAVAYDRDPRVTRPDSIIAALSALQSVRKASPVPLVVRLSNIDFSFMNLQDLDLSGINASHAIFRNAFLSGCRCSGAVFNHADLREAVIWTDKLSDFSNTEFIQAKIGGSKWKNVDMSGSSIESASGQPAIWEHIVPPEKQALFP